MSVEMLGASEGGLGDIVNSITYGGSGGIWLVVNFLFNWAFPAFMVYDMLGMTTIAALIAVAVDALYSLFIFIAGVEILTGRVILP
jgi:hypothetical protein